MSEPDQLSGVPDSLVEPDVEMGDEVNGDEVDARDGAADDSAIDPPAANPQTVFLDYLRSPIVEIEVGGSPSTGGDAESTLITAHEAILSKSPYLARILSSLPSSGRSPRRIKLPDDTIDAVACFLQYEYTGEYFPRRLSNTPDGLEPDPSIPDVDSTGEQLLKHARIYNLAEKLGLPSLKTLAHSKIHRINSTAQGEIAYAKYVYGNTPADDVTIRKPVAAFWATRSHVLRREAEAEFRKICLDFPQFGFDVLSLMLDQREKREKDRASVREDAETPGGAKGRKRMRPSVHI